jgi:hypothetical protein
MSSKGVVAMNEFTYSVFVVDGEWTDATDPITDCLRFDGLGWDEACGLAKMGCDQGYQVSILRQDNRKGGNA